MTFCERLATRREAAGKSKTEIAKEAGMTVQGYLRLENGTGGKTFEKLPIIAKALGCRIDDLFPEMDQKDDEEVNFV